MSEMNCEEGRHGALKAGEPQDLGECVNIDWHCPHCGKRVIVESWGKEDWLADQQLHTARAEKAVKRAKGG